MYKNHNVIPYSLPLPPPLPPPPPPPLPPPPLPPPLLPASQVPLRLVVVCGDAVHVVSPVGGAILTTALLPPSPTVNSVAYLPADSTTTRLSVCLSVCLCDILMLSSCLSVCLSVYSDQLLVLTDEGTLKLYNTNVRPCYLKATLSPEQLTEGEWEHVGQPHLSWYTITACCSHCLLLCRPVHVCVSA